MELTHLSENLIEELMHYHLFVFRDIDAEEFTKEQERLKDILEDREEE